MGNDDDQDGHKISDRKKSSSLKRVQELAYRRQMNQLRRERMLGMKAMKEASTGQPENRPDPEKTANSEPLKEALCPPPTATRIDIIPEK